nr:MAG TPA: hypothetical protein [Caudoviricetes sp.]
MPRSCEWIGILLSAGCILNKTTVVVFLFNNESLRPFLVSGAN